MFTKTTVVLTWIGVVASSPSWSLADPPEQTRDGSAKAGLAEDASRTDPRLPFADRLIAMRLDADDATASHDTTAEADVVRLAATHEDQRGAAGHDLSRVPLADSRRLESLAADAVVDPIARAQEIIAACRERFQSEVRDYSCIFFKQERIGGRLTPQYAMQMKVRTQPKSVYVKILKPDFRAGREAIHVDGRQNGKVLVHDVGWGKFLAGTLSLDPRGARAMEDCRHPITDAGIGHMLDTIAERWAIEMKPGETQVTIRPGVTVGDRPCTLLVSTHPERKPGYMFHSVRVYIDQELQVPVRFEAYDWPARPGVAPELVEQYSFSRLQLNVGLNERDFDPSNAQYSFGRF